MKSDLRRFVELLFCENETNAGIGRKVGHHRDTVRRMRTKLGLMQLSAEQVSEMSDEQLSAALGTFRKHHRGFVEPDYDALLADLGKPGKNKSHLYQTYLEQTAAHPSGELQQMGRSKFYQELRNRQKARGLEYRHVYHAGEIMQFDFIGKKPYLVDRSGEKTFVEIAVSVLPYSNLIFALAVRTQNLRDSISSLAATLDYFCAVPQNIILDNFKAAITTPKTLRKPAVINRHFKAALDHYSIVPDPTYAANPRHKGSVENAVKIVTSEFIGSERFLGSTSLSELNLRLREVIDRLNERPMKTCQGRSRREIYEEDEKPHMRPLPVTSYQYGEWREGITVPLHYHVRVGATEYSVPYRLVGQKANIKVLAEVIEIYVSGSLQASHTRASGSTPRVTLPEHQPDNHLAMNADNNESVLERAKRLGPDVHAFVNRHLETHSNGKAAMVMCRRFEKKIRHHGRDAFSKALREAMARGQINATAVYTLLERTGLHNEDDDMTASPPPSGNVRGSSYYDDGEDD